MSAPVVSNIDDGHGLTKFIKSAEHGKQECDLFPSIAPAIAVGLLKDQKIAKNSTHPGAAHHALPETGFVRLHQIIGNLKAQPPVPPIIPVSRSTWWAGVRSGRYPQPVRTLGRRITAWRVEDIRLLVAKLEDTRKSVD